MTDDDKQPGWRDDETLVSGKGVSPAGSPTIPGYDILRELGRGGQGVVYLAWQKSVERNVAIKVLSDGGAACGPSLGLFQQEAKLVANLHHPNIVIVHDSDVTADRRVFIVMDFIDGASLAERVHVPPAPRMFGENLRLFVKICEAVGAAHTAGVVHCDLKPGNIHLDNDGNPHILDFGLARLNDPAGNPDVSVGFAGTIPWVSPEQAAGRGGLDGTTDVYALGVILFQLLTGRLPFDNTGDAGERLQRVINGPTLNFPTRPDALDDELTAIIKKCLSRKPTARYPTARLLADDVRHYLTGRPVDAMGPRRLYGFFRRATALSNRHPFLALCTVAMIACTVAYWANDLLLAHTPGIDRLYRRTVQNLTPSPPPTAALDRVRVIAISDHSNLSAFGQSQGLPPYDPANPQTIRPYCGRLLQRLVAVNPKVVVFDITFRRSSPFDAELLEGLKAASAAHIPVVLAAPAWKLNDRGLPEICPEFLPYARWGCFTADLSSTAPWALETAVRRGGDEEVLLSLSLSTLAAYCQPRAQCEVVVDDLARTCELRYWIPNPAIPQTRPWLEHKDRLGLTAFQTQSHDIADGDFRAGDLKAFFQLQMPADDVLRNSTIDYQDAVTADLVTLRPKLEGCAVLIANQRTGVDTHRYLDGRDIFGSFAHAVGISAMIAGLPDPRPTGYLPFVMAGLAVLAALVCGALLPYRTLTRLGALAALTSILILISLLIGSWARTLCNPTNSIIALFICSELTALVYRTRRILHR